MRRAIGITALVFVGLALLGGTGTWLWRSRWNKEPKFRTVSAKRGDLTAMISATGTVEPEEVVDVGAQVAGQILYFGTDNNNNTIDYGSFVKKGAVLAQIDDTLYTADVENYKAQVQQAIASQANANANVQQMKAKLMQAEADWRRAQTLGPSQALAPTSYDQYKANYEVA